MKSEEIAAKTSSPWFAIRKDLDSKQRLILSCFSFLLPILIWVIVSYTPFIWHPDVKLQLSADRTDVTTIYSAGDRLSKEFYPSFVEAIQSDNAEILAAREQGEVDGSASRIRRANLKVMRHITPVVTANGWLTRDEVKDESLYGVWQKLAEGSLEQKRVQLSAENMEIIKRNWALMSERSEVFDSKLLPETPLEKLVPQGKPSNPSYLPSPHEVVVKGIQDFTAEADGNNPSLFQRYRHSLRIVFLGFLFAALVGVPLGVICGTFDFFSKLFEPFIDFFRYMPAPAFSTLLVAVFLANDAPKIALVFVGTFFQLVLVVANTTRQLDASLLEAAQTLGANKSTQIRRVILPGILPDLFNDLRILLGWAWTWLVIAELIGVKSGLTEFMDTQGRFRNFDSVFPVIILIGVSGFVTDQILSSLRKYLFPWTPESSSKKHGFIGRFIYWLLDRKVYDSPLNGKV
ncbi:MAG: ABC transporter permease [Opitutales bacterium]|jgi:NitT/TauT family transport system permease protein|nr:ABC transporter permease [Opitutales bacterium]MDP4644188.1 ABC transporter permease [Opitutales bacterium]MDP4776721.1 ABC transporter permease [Opitutales bacterium]MDP4878270.1 ABC transporter permease [Opitutales bacterium]MDP4883739.1 ABC transporter permease [Opitutales bacterium]